MDSEESVDRWPKRLTGLFLVGACLALLIPAGAHQGVLPFGLESRWVWSSLFGGVACCLVAFVGFMVLAMRKGRAKRVARAQERIRMP